ncbi:MAG: L-erythro-3,5-diaminohexanoate dehydrogenase [Thermoleophilia bacterium]
MKSGDRFGAHRVIEPTGVLPQPALRIDNTMEIYDNEILIDVDTLNIDAASFTQIESTAGSDVRRMARRSLDIVAARGKHHNPDTGSGGMLLGTVAAIGPKLADRPLQVGDRIATLVSLSLTPLKIDEIVAINRDTCQMTVSAQAILFESGIYAKMPDDFDEALALAILDVAGAPAQTTRLCHPGDTVFIIGAGGKSGLLCAYAARQQVGASGRVIGLVHGDAGKARLERTGFCDTVLQGNATDQLAVYLAVHDATNSMMADLTINCVDVPDTEMASILATKDSGTVYFFSMATSFTAAALGAEGIGADTTMLIGNGYTKNHAETALNSVRQSTILREVFEETYATGAGVAEPVGLRANDPR